MIVPQSAQTNMLHRLVRQSLQLEILDLSLEGKGAGSFAAKPIWVKSGASRLSSWFASCDLFLRVSRESRPQP